MSPPLRFFAAMLAAAVVTAPVVAFAQADAQAPADSPSYARPTYGNDEDVIHGHIVSFDGGFTLRVRDDRGGFIDNVELHQGTIINPTGLTLSPGMSVTIHGVNRGNVLDANQIDTPYQSYGAVPVYPYPAYGYPGYGFGYGAYPFPAYGYRYGYGYGYGFAPRIGIGVGIGHGGRFR